MDDLPDYEESDGELIAMPGDESDVTDTDDGGAIVRLDDEDGDIDDPCLLYTSPSPRDA